MDTFPKTDMRHWQGKIFQPSYTRDGETRLVKEWAVKIQYQGRRETFNLHTANKATAAAKAKEIYAMLVGAGWAATLEKHKPEMRARPCNGGGVPGRVARALVGQAQNL